MPSFHPESAVPSAQPKPTSLSVCFLLIIPVLQPRNLLSALSSVTIATVSHAAFGHVAVFRTQSKHVKGEKVTLLSFMFA